MKRNIALVLILILACVFFAGCNDSYGRMPDTAAPAPVNSAPQNEDGSEPAAAPAAAVDQNEGAYDALSPEDKQALDSLFDDKGITEEQRLNPTFLNAAAAAFIANKTEIGQSGTDVSDTANTYLADNFIVSPEVRTALEKAFDVKKPPSSYSDILFLPQHSASGFETTIKEGEILYISAGIYTIIAPNGQMYERFFGEETVANDYFYVPGTYIISGYPVVTTLERGEFAAIGGKIFHSQPSLLGELQGSYVRALDLHVVGTSLQQASYDGMAKQATYSRFVMSDGEFETMSTLQSGKVNVTIVG